MAFPTQIDSAGAGQFSCTTSFDPSINAGFPGVFSDGPNDRYTVHGDLVNFVLRCYKSSDAGVSFVEQDAANAPAIANDAGSPQPGNFELWCSCYDSTNKIIYTVYWSVDFKITIIPFKVGTGWQARTKSTLDYVFVKNLSQAGTNLACEFRPADNVVWMGFCRYSRNVNNSGSKVYGAKFAVGVGWDAGDTLLYGVDGDGLDWGLGGFRRDSAGNIHLNFTSKVIGVGTGTINHGVIHPDNSVSALQQIQMNALRQYDLVSVPFISAKDKISFMFLQGARGVPPAAGQGMFVARGQGPGDTPVWLVEQPAPILLPNNNGGNSMLQGTASFGGIDYIFYNYYTAGGNTANFAYIFDSGGGWGAEQIIGTIDTSGGGTYIAAGVCIPSVVGSFGVVFQLVPTVPGTFGMGFAGIAGAAAAQAPPRVPLLAVIPFPIKRCLTPRRTMGARPELVHCIMPSPDGKLYVPVKGPLINRECC